MPVLQVKEIQGIILRGYGALESACFLLLEVTDARRAKEWLKALPLRSAETRPEGTDQCINVAFTPAGLKKLGLPDDRIAELAGELNEGIAGTEHRRRILGDHGDSQPDLWRWGGPRNDAVDMLLLCYAGDEQALRALVEREVGDHARRGLRLVETLPTILLRDRKEHFGFRDGISQPLVEGFEADAGGPAENTVAAGEFVLGYPNAYGQYTDGPKIAPEHTGRASCPTRRTTRRAATSA
jgi:deferrochelatase/peroxidase EfeB